MKEEGEEPVLGFAAALADLTDAQAVQATDKPVPDASTRGPSAARADVNLRRDLKSRIDMSNMVPEVRIAVSVEDISRYLGEIKQMLEDLSARPDIDNSQIVRIATAVSEIQRLVPALLQR